MKRKKWCVFVAHEIEWRDADGPKEAGEGFLMEYEHHLEQGLFVYVVPAEAVTELELGLREPVG